MNDRKQSVINTAHELFIEKGYQATSIQDILDESGISKGTFYNYFQSKGELLIAIFKSIHNDLEKDRNNLLIGQDRSDIEIFIKQIELQMYFKKKNKLFSLFEEVFVSNDADLKQFIKQAQLMQLGWYYNRLIDIFGEERKPYLLDCTIMFLGLLHYNFQYHFREYEESVKIHQVIRYSVNRLVKMVGEVSEADEQLFDPSLIEKWLPGSKNPNHGIKCELIESVSRFKKIIDKKLPLDEAGQMKHFELLDFIQEELLHSRQPRKFLIESALYSLKANHSEIRTKELQELEHLVFSYLKDLEGSK